MRRPQWGRYGLALAVLVVGLVALGVPASTLVFGALVLACPLMMLFMHGSHSHSHDEAERTDRSAPSPRHDHETTGRR